MTLTLPKLLLLALVAWLVWTFLRKSKIIGGANRGGDAARPKGQPAERAIEDMVKCPKCGAYVPALGAHDCAKIDRGA